jgi:hypothetical protein
LGTPDTDNNSQTQPYDVTLLASGSVLTADFGYFKGGGGGSGDPVGIIGNQVWHDLNGNGLYEPGLNETGIAGVTVDLHLSGSLVATTTTGASGNYIFTDLAAGTYTVTVSDNAGVLTDYQVTQPGPTPGADNNNQVQPYTIVLPADAFNFTADFGYVQPATIGDFLFVDFNGNGIQDPGETAGIPGLVVTATNQSTLQTYTAVSDVNGVYTITVPPGSYVVTAQSTAPNMTLTTAPIAMTMTSGGQFKDADFGYISPTAVTLASFTVVADAEGVLLRWTTFSEQNQEGFVVWRAPAEDGPYSPVSELIPAANDPAGAGYEWLDATAVPGVGYWYKLESRPDGEMFGPIPSRDDPGDSETTLYMPVILN